MRASTAIIRQGVELGAGAVLGDFVIVGEWMTGELDVPPPDATNIGVGARLRSHTVIYAGVQAGDGFQTGHGALVREFTTIGHAVSIGSHSVVEHHVKIGDRVRIHTSAFIPEYCVLEDDCWIGPRVTMTNAPHPRCVNIPKCLNGVTVRRGAKIGANVTILPGVVIGENALVGAGAVVTKDVLPGTVVAGAPARGAGSVYDLICPADGETHAYPRD